MPKTLKKIKKELLLDEIKRDALENLGYLEKVKKDGWDSLNSKECGRVGGLISSKKRKKASVN